MLQTVYNIALFSSPSWFQLILVNQNLILQVSCKAAMGHWKTILKPLKSPRISYLK